MSQQLKQDKIAATEKTMIDKRSKKKVNKDAYIRIFTLIGFFIVWQLICMYNERIAGGVFINPNFLPSPSTILRKAGTLIQNGSLFKHIMASLQRMVWGFGWGLLVAVLLGILVTSSKLADNIVSPILGLIQPIPAFAFLPLFIIWFGVGETSKIIMIAYMSFGSIYPYFVDGIRNTNPLLIRSALSLGASKSQVFLKVVLKSSLPNLFLGMRMGIGSTFSALLVAELMGANEGLGYMINYARNYFMIDQMFVGAITIGLEFTLFSSLMDFIEKTLFRWKYSGADKAIE